MKYDIKNLTLDEKLSLLEGVGNWRTSNANGKVKPLLLMDGPQGLRIAPTSEESPVYGMSNEELAKVEPTAMPSCFNLANSWNTEAAYLDGNTIADDCIDFGVDVLLAPGVNMKRTALCGRNFEYFSEDPYLAGHMAKSYIEGVQSKKVGTSLKHFCMNNREHDRFHISSEADERTIREIYTSAFEIAVKAQPWTVMCAYNLINGVYAAENKWLLNDVLRGEFGFDGLIVSDWRATREPWRAVKATLDLCMPKQEYAAGLRRAIDEGIITEAEIDERVERMLALIEKTEVEKKSATTKQERHERSVELAKESFVLLKNEDSILPLRKGKILVAEFTDNGFHHAPIGGGGSAKVDVLNPLKKLDGLIAENLGEAAEVSSVDNFVISSRIVARQAKIINRARQNDAVVLCVGNDHEIEGEAFDRQNIRLDAAHERMILNVAEQNENVIVCVFAGSAIDMSPWIDKVKAVILVGFAGEGVHEALADTLCGLNNPSGKLSETFPLSLDDAPAGAYEGNGLVDSYDEGIFIGYRWYDKKKKEVLFPFGYGLSYSKFEYSDLKIEKKGETDYEVSYLITNTSDTDGSEVSQLYVSDPVAMVSRPVKELKGFNKTFIPAGESRRVTLPLNFRSFAYYNLSLKRWYVENGEFEIMIGASSRDIRLSESIYINLDEREQLSQE